MGDVERDAADGDAVAEAVGEIRCRHCNLLMTRLGGDSPPSPLVRYAHNPMRFGLTFAFVTPPLRSFGWLLPGISAPGNAGFSLKPSVVLPPPDVPGDGPFAFLRPPG